LLGAELLPDLEDRAYQSPSDRRMGRGCALVATRMNPDEGDRTGSHLFTGVAIVGVQLTLREMLATKANSTLVASMSIEKASQFKKRTLQGEKKASFAREFGISRETLPIYAAASQV
jgi:hypothetical protein